jgi:hypothetical protein
MSPSTSSSTYVCLLGGYVFFVVLSFGNAGLAVWRFVAATGVRKYVATLDEYIPHPAQRSAAVLSYYNVCTLGALSLPPLY